jgi:WD40-like Beta Propeller Repeat
MFWTRLAAASLMAILAASACTTEEASAPSGEPKERRKRTAGDPDEPSELVYVKGTSLFLYDLDSDRRHKVAELPSADVAVSPNGKKYAVVDETSPAGSTSEGFRKPVLRLGSLQGQDTRELGPGRSPLWSPDGKYVAAIAKARGVFSCDARPGDPRRTTTCRETELVVAYWVARNDRQRIALSADRWSLIGWTAADQILATSLIFENVVLGYPGASSEEAETLNLEPAEVWGVSPSEYTLLVVRDGRTFFASPGVGEGATVDLDGALLGDGAWSPDGKQVAAVSIQQLAEGSPRSKVVVVDVATGKVEAVPRSKNAQSAAVWSQGSDFFAYVRVDPARASKLQAVLCSTELDCDTLFSWGQGVALLALR